MIHAVLSFVNSIDGLDALLIGLFVGYILNLAAATFK